MTTSSVDDDSTVVIKATGAGGEKTVRIVVLIAGRTCTAGASDDATHTMGALAFDDAGTGADCFQDP